ncbi:MAG: hypothetical protein JRE38_01610 [Deltaproteobacteria bacterium]|nr:hypothetical protein [Deltaproteobacteria bacterium]MBW2576745.1 hypothetical protein [Deltaproteobacteria bacterium]MBW2691183.1 hypothetical protein [Deltaproteobacteria bacterium]
MKPAILFLVKFVCLTAPFIWLWHVGGFRYYHALYSPVAEAVYGWLGLEGVEATSRIRYINLIPFLTLMVLTPNLSTRRRLGGTAIGLVILFAMHIAVNLTANPRTQILPQMVRLMLDAAPFFLWVIIAREFVRDFMQRGTVRAAEKEPAKSEDG